MFSSCQYRNDYKLYFVGKNACFSYKTFVNVDKYQE